MWLFYAVAFPTVVAAVGYLLYVMPAPNTTWHIKVDVGLAWLAALSLLVLVPVDVGNTQAAIETQDLKMWWLIIYWYSFVVQVLVLPLHSSMVSSCEFTIWDRVVYTMRCNFTFYGLALLGGGVGLLVLKYTNDKVNSSMILGYCTALSNAYGLIATGLLMGYGLVAIPRTMWRAGNVRQQHRMLCGKAGKQAARLATAYKGACDTARLVERVSGMFHRRDPLRQYVDKLVDMLTGSSINPSMGDSTNDEVELDYLTRPELGTLRRKLSDGMDAFEREKAAYLATVKAFIEVEEVVTNMDMAGRRFISSGRGAQSGGCWPALEWWWKCRLRSWMFRLLSVGLWLLSGAVVLCEATISEKIPFGSLSAFAWALRRITQYNQPVLLLQLATFVFLAYPCIATYYALYKAGRFSFYLLVPGHTSSASLCSNALFMTRFASPLAFNFIYAMAMPEYNSPNVENTVFWDMIGKHIMNAPVFGYQFTTWVPMLLIPYILLCLLNVPHSLLDMAGMAGGGKRVTFEDDWECTTDYETNGQRLLRMEFESQQRGGPVGGTVALVTGQGRSGTSLQALYPDQGQRKKGWRLWGRSSSPDKWDATPSNNGRSKLTMPLLGGDRSVGATPDATPVHSFLTIGAGSDSRPASSGGRAPRGPHILAASPTSGLCFFKKGLMAESGARTSEGLPSAPSLIQYINVDSDDEDDGAASSSALKGMFNKLRWGKK